MTLWQTLHTILHTWCLNTINARNATSPALSRTCSIPGGMERFFLKIYIKPRAAAEFNQKLSIVIVEALNWAPTSSTPSACIQRETMNVIVVPAHSPIPVLPNIPPTVPPPFAPPAPPMSLPSYM